MPEPSVLTILWVIQRNPHMYLWGGTRREQLNALQATLTGYAFALRQHQVGQRDLVVVGELEQFLRERSGAEDTSGIDHVLSISSDPDVAWQRVWELIDEFRHQKGHTA